MYLVAGLLVLALPAAARNTGGVFGPVVNEGHRSLQYRSAYDLDSYGFAQRLHYQQSLNGDLRLRGVLQTVKNADSDLDLDFFQAELLWQLDDLSDSWQHALRFDLRIRTEGRPGLVGLHWTNQIDFGDRWIARFIAMTTTDFGDGASGDIGLQTRASLSRAVGSSARLGIETFNVYGVVGDVPGLDEQQHQAGPTFSASLGGRWSLFASAVFGLTDATPDAQARLWFTRGF